MEVKIVEVKADLFDFILLPEVLILILVERDLQGRRRRVHFLRILEVLTDQVEGVWNSYLGLV